MLGIKDYEHISMNNSHMNNSHMNNSWFLVFNSGRLGSVLKLKTYLCITKHTILICCGLELITIAEKSLLEY